MPPRLYQPCLSSGTLKIWALLEADSRHPGAPTRRSQCFSCFEGGALPCAAFRASGFLFFNVTSAANPQREQGCVLQ